MDPIILSTENFDGFDYLAVQKLLKNPSLAEKLISDKDTSSRVLAAAKIIAEATKENPINEATINWVHKGSECMYYSLDNGILLTIDLLCHAPSFTKGQKITWKKDGLGIRINDNIYLKPSIISGAGKIQISRKSFGMDYFFDGPWSPC